MIAVDSHERVWFRLQLDDAQPEGATAEWCARYLTVREYMRFRECLKAAEAGGTDDERFGQILAALAIGLVGWRNVTDRNGVALLFPAEASGKTLDCLLDVCTPADLLELPYAMDRAITLSEESRKKSAWLSRSEPNPADSEAPATI